MGYVAQTLNPGEQIVHTTTLHPLIFFEAVIFAALALWIATSDDFRRLAVLPLALAAISAVYNVIRYKCNEFAVTTSRVVLKTGWLKRITIEMQLGSVEAISVVQSLPGRIFGFGTLRVGGSGGTVNEFPYVLDPIEFRRQIQQQANSRHARVATVDGTQGDGGDVRHERECPYCAERVLVRAIRCRFCGQLLTPGS